MQYERDKWIFFVIYTLSACIIACTPQQYKDLPETNWVGIADGDTIDLYERQGNNIYFNEIGYSKYTDTYNLEVAKLWTDSMIIRSYGIEFYHDLKLSDSLWRASLRPLCKDSEHFEICRGSGYARDLHLVYYPICIVDYDCFDDSLQIGYGGGDLSDYIVEGANPKYFKYVKDGYGVDRWKMYKDGIRIEWDDSIFEKE